MKFKFNRKKLTFRRFSYYLFIITIVVSCIANGIFAKFTTEDYGGDGGRVAKFGIVLNVTGDLFASVYNKYVETDVDDGNGGTVKQETADSNSPTIITADENNVSVKASTNDDGSYDNVVAPGTKNDVGINVSVTGMPETDYELSYVLSNFETVALYGGSSDTTYGLMVPFEEGIVNESNFKKIVANGLYTSSDDKNYTRVTDADSFDSSAKYYKLKDIVVIQAGVIYSPIRYYIIDNVGNNIHSLNQNFKLTDFSDDGSGLYSSFATNTFSGTGTGTGHIGSASGSKKFETNVEIDENFNFTWEWPYHQDTDAETLAWCNACDTILGNIAAGKNVVKGTAGLDGDFDNILVTNDSQNEISANNVNYNLDISFDLDITVNQID